MNKLTLTKRYFNWLCDIVGNSYPHCERPYHKLLDYLFNVDFDFQLESDADREADGVELRYIFGSKKFIDMRIISEYLDDRPCSVLEMMVALSIRCEENIMDNPDEGKRTGQWFWNMIINLGLEPMIDDCYNKNYVSKVIDRFLKREYEPNGKGGLFYINNCYYDLRYKEIWYQMMWYLDKYYDE